MDDRRIIGGIVHVLRSAPEYNPHMISISPGRCARPGGASSSGITAEGLYLLGMCRNSARAEVAAERLRRRSFQDAAPCCAKRQLVLEQHPRKSTANTSSLTYRSHSVSPDLSRATRSNRGLQPLPRPWVHPRKARGPFGVPHLGGAPALTLPRSCMLFQGSGATGG